MCGYQHGIKYEHGVYVQENGHIKCHQYYPPDDKPPDAPNFVQFDQVMITQLYVQ